MDGESLVAFLMALEQGDTNVFGKVELFVAYPDLEELPTPANLHIPVFAADLFPNSQDSRFHDITSSIIIITPLRTSKFWC